MKRKTYPSDLSDEQWQLLAHIYHRPNSLGDGAKLIYAKSAMRFFTFCELAARVSADSFLGNDRN
jgi:hypothetical protein